MIGITILGLGMVMVATIFPVAWNRARTLSEYTVQRTVIAGALGWAAASNGHYKIAWAAFIVILYCVGVIATGRVSPNFRDWFVHRGHL